MKTKHPEKNCQSFMNCLYSSDLYPVFRDLLFQWRKNDQLHVGAIDTFQKISALLQDQNCDENLLQRFNRCLIKEIPFEKINVCQRTFKFPQIRENSQPKAILNQFQEWIDQDRIKIDKKKSLLQSAPHHTHMSLNKPNLSNIDVLKETQIIQKILNSQQRQLIAKLIHLYLKCIITHQELKSLLLPLYTSEPSLLYWIVKYAQSIRSKRYKRTIFSPLIQLTNQKYPFQQVGISYIMVPDGYAQYSKQWKKTDSSLQVCLNRKLVLVPLVGSEQEFFISPKTDSQKQMFHLEDQGYETDYMLQCLKACIKQIQNACKASPITQRAYRLQNPMMKRIIASLYPFDNVSSIFINNIQMARDILLPRLKQKEEQLKSCRRKFVKTYSDAANKLFYKGLDYRYFHFAYNDKKYNSPNFWQKEINLRKKTIQHLHKQINQNPYNQKQHNDKNQHEMMEEDDEISENQSFKKDEKNEKKDNKHKIQHSAYIRSRYQTVNTFDNVLGKFSQQNLQEQNKYGAILKSGIFNTQDFDLSLKMQEQEKAKKQLKTDQQYSHQFQSSYPKYPDNQLLFIMDFSNSKIFNDVMQIILYNCPSSRKRIIQLMIFKIFRKNIEIKMPKYTNLINMFENYQDNILNVTSNRKQKQQSAVSSFHCSEDVLLNQAGKQNRHISYNYKTEQEQFMDMIQDEEQPTNLQQMNIPFELPKNKKFYILLGTKMMYMFLKSILTIYQRFLKAYEYSQESMNANDNKDDNHYNKFLAILIHKLKDKKSFEECLRKIFSQDAFIFFTLDKIISNAIKIIISISSGDLSYKILKDQTKDFQFELFSWDKFPFPNLRSQLYRLILEKQKLFSFSYQPCKQQLYISSWLPPYHDVRHKNPQINNKRTTQYTNEPCQILKPVQTQAKSTQYENSQYLYTTLIKNQNNQNKKNKYLQRKITVYRGESILISDDKWKIDNDKIYETDKKKITNFINGYSCF